MLGERTYPPAHESAPVLTSVGLSGLFQACGEELTVGGNTPFLLNEPDTVWLVHSGKVEVFAVSVAAGEPQGTRYHYFTAQVGDALFGMDLDRCGEGLGLVAVGIVGTRLLKMPRLHLQSAARTEDLSAPVAELVDRWIAGLSAGVAKSIVPQPRADLTLDAGDTGPLAAGKRARARKRVTWIRHLQGGSLFIGMEEIPGDLAFPLAPEAFVQALEPATLVATDTATALGTDEGWAGLEALHGAIFRCEFFNIRLAAADELNRLRQKADRDLKIRERSLGALAAVLERPSHEFPTEADDPLLAACTLVGRRLDVSIQAPPRPKEGEWRDDPVAEIAESSRIRVRRVVLKGEWWREDAAPLLAYVEEGRRPVALVPCGRRFEIHDPVARTRMRVTAEVAARLAPTAYTFYRPFPETALKPMRLFRFSLFQCRRDLLRLTIVGLGAGLLGLAPPYFTGVLVDTVVPEASGRQLMELTLMLVVIGLTTSAFGLVRSLGTLRLETVMSAAVQPAIWDRLLRLRAPFFRQFSAGDLAQRAGAIDAIRRVMSGAAMSSVMAGLFSIFLGAQLFYYSGRLALIAVGLVLLALAVTMGFALVMLRLVRPAMAIEGRIAGLMLQLLTGIAKLRVTGAEHRAFGEWAREFAAQKRLAMRAGTIQNGLQIFNAVSPVATSMVIYSLLLSLSREALTGGRAPLSPGDFVAFNTAFGLFLGQMLALGSALLSVATVVLLYERAQPILMALPEVDGTKLDPGDLTGRIDVEHVTFRYHPDGPAILNDVSIRAAPGEFIAIVGPSGSGKSTLFRLLLGFEMPETGSVSYDGRDVGLIDLQKLRRKMGVVMQNGRIRAGSILENIIGSSPLTPQDALEACRMAGFEDDLRQMPMGLHTVLPQGGGTLSGGQRQRLMIARAIVHRPRLLLFDEATSALDNRTQAIVSRSLQELQATRMVIAHRLSTIQGADRIYVLEAGRVVQVGPYADLVREEGLFAELIRRQVA